MLNFHLFNFNQFFLYFKNDRRLHIHIFYVFFIRIIIQRHNNKCIHTLVKRCTTEIVRSVDSVQRFRVDIIVFVVQEYWQKWIYFAF